MTDSNAAQNDGELYAAHRKIYPREVSGFFQTLRSISAFGLLGVFYGLPWLQWPLFGAHGHQAVLFDMPARKFHIFGLIFLPQDFYLLTWLLVIAAVSLFFFTALAGRLWCGYACPQTVWTEVFVRMERLVEGDRLKRMKLDRAPWSVAKALRKIAKHALWGALALWTGFTFVGFFTPIRELAHSVQLGALGPWETFWILFYGFATYGNAGHMREQVCKYMCPYARFQSAMIDRHTLVIAYNGARGEPRGPRARAADRHAKGLGDCVDCTLCVQACPTGIDIRDGLQYECIACAACIDACDSVMTKMNYPLRLVRYSTQAASEGDATHAWRARTFIYGALLLALVGGFFFAVTHRNLAALDVLRDRNALYRQLDDGRIENVYTVRIVNKDAQAHQYRLSVSDLPGAVIDSDRATHLVAGAQVASVTVRIRAPKPAVGGGRDIVVKLDALDAPQLTAQAKARFFTPL